MTVDPAQVAANERRMAFTEHLLELRTRLRNACIALGVASCITWPLHEPLVAILARPLIKAHQAKFGATSMPELNILHPLDGFMVSLKVSLMAALFLALPVILHEVWKFVAPGLYAREKRMVLPLVAFAVVLFCGGAAFAYLYVMPKGYEFFLSFANNDAGSMKNIIPGVSFKSNLNFAVKPMISIDFYYSLTTKLILMFGAVFELPMVLSVLAMLGVVTPGMLWRFNRFFILIAFVAGAVLTPGDLVVGQVAMGLSLTVLYNFSIVLALIVGKSKKAAAPAPDDVGGGDGDDDDEGHAALAKTA